MYTQRDDKGKGSFQRINEPNGAIHTTGYDLRIRVLSLDIAHRTRVASEREDVGSRTHIPNLEWCFSHNQKMGLQALTLTLASRPPVTSTSSVGWTL